jgi:hypothetical protein
MRKIPLFFILLFILFGCAPKKDKQGGLGYLKDSTLTNQNGYLFDSTKSYFPEKYFMNGKWVKQIYKDSSDMYNTKFWLHHYSVNLYFFKVPVLYNYYQSVETFRFLWLRNFHEPVLITVSKDGRETYLNTKMLNEKPPIYTTVYNYYGNDMSDFSGDDFSGGDLITEENNIEKLWKEYPKADSIVVPHNNIKFLVDTTFKLDSEKWNEFIKLVYLCGFWEQKPIKSWGGCDGAQWVLEGQTYDKYHFVSRWSPKDEFRVCCEYLIRISQLPIGKRAIY